MLKKILVLASLTHCMYCCGQGKARVEHPTPEEYKYNIHISRDDYSKDSISLAGEVRRLIALKKKPILDFLALDEDTEIIIDTIVYSPQRDKAALFVVMKYKNEKLEPPPRYKDDYLAGGVQFKGECMLAVKKGDSWCIGVYSYQVSCHGSNYNSIKELLYYYCFLYTGGEFKLAHDEIDRNLDDIRLWKLKIWNKKPFGDCD